MITTHIPGTDRDEDRIAGGQGRDGKRRRRVLTSMGGLVVAGLILALGTVMSSNANFSERYVTEQLAQQRITFRAAEALTDEERKSSCVVENAGRLLTTGAQAECFANEFIGLHVKSLANGRTYAEVSDTQMALRARVAAAQANGDPALPDLQKQLADVSRQTDTLFRAESLRGMLLTSYGFGTLGEKAAEAATVAYGAAAIVALLSVAGLVFALVRRPGARVAHGR